MYMFLTDMFSPFTKKQKQNESWYLSNNSKQNYYFHQFIYHFCKHYIAIEREREMKVKHERITLKIEIFCTWRKNGSMKDIKKYEKYQTVYFWFVDVDYLNKDFISSQVVEILIFKTQRPFGTFLKTRSTSVTKKHRFIPNYLKRSLNIPPFHTFFFKFWIASDSSNVAKRPQEFKMSCL